MSAGLLVWYILAFLGLNLALVAWLILRVTIGGFWAMIWLQTVLLTTVWGILSLIP